MRTDLCSRLVRAWGLVPAAVDERAVADGLLDGAPPPDGLLLDRGFLSRAWAAGHCARGTGAQGHRGTGAQGHRGTQVVYAHGRAERQTLSPTERRPVAALRSRVETTIGELTDALGLARHGAKTVWGLLARTAATILAHTLLRLALV